MIKKYSAKYRCDVSLIDATKNIINQMITHKWQIWLSIKKKIQSTYQQDKFGLFWSIVMPIIPMTIYIILAQVKVFHTVKDMPFIFYIVTGMFMWLLMSTSIHKMMIALKSEKSVLTTTNFPIFPVLLSRMGEVLHDSGVRVIALVIVIIIYHIKVSILSILFALLSIIPAIIFALGIGMILSILDIIIQDTRRVVLIMLRYGMFFSSVIVPFPDSGILGKVAVINFFNTFVNATRDILYYGHLNNAFVYIITSLIGVIIFMIASKMLYSLDYKIREYL